MPLAGVFAAVAVVGLVLGGVSLVVLRRSEGHPGMARRLAGPRQVKVGELLDGELPPRPVRVVGRVRCRDPLDTGDGEKLVAFHRDVDVRIGGRWRSLERLRETRSFDLWDHDDVARHSAAILQRLSERTMPCDADWPDAQIALFRDWISAGKPA